MASDLENAVARLTERLTGEYEHTLIECLLGGAPEECSTHENAENDAIIAAQEAIASGWATTVEVRAGDLRMILAALAEKGTP